MITLFGYHIIKVPGTRWYKFLKKSEFEPRTPVKPSIKRYYLKTDVDDLSSQILKYPSYLYADDDSFDRHVTNILDRQVEDFYSPLQS